MYVSMHICNYTNMQVCKIASWQGCKFASRLVCKYACIQVCMNASIHVCTYTFMQVQSMQVCNGNDKIIKNWRKGNEGYKNKLKIGKIFPPKYMKQKILVKPLGRGGN